MRFTKPPLSHEQQAALLVSRGMIVTDYPALMRQLRNVGYYRLCAYWYPFKQPDNTFAAGTSFDTVWSRYVFDRRLRLAVIDAIERVEVAVRAALATELALHHGAFAHVPAAHFPHVHPLNHARFLEDLRESARRSKETFVEHFQANYDEFPDLPIWAAMETMTFGALFTLFRMSERRVQKNVAARCDVAGPVLLSWLHTLNYVRNLCAHHARLWNRELAIKPSIPDAKHDPRWHIQGAFANNRLFVVLTLLRVVLRQVAPQSAWHVRLYDLFDKSSAIPLAPMGMTPHWRAHPLWRD